jgi:hypothetical protein
MQTNLPDPVVSPGNIAIPTNDDQNVSNGQTGNNNVYLQDPTSISGGGMHKEVESIKPLETSTYEENMPDMEIAPELEQIGVEVKNETIELPPDLKKMGVTAVGPAQPMMPVQTVKFPISDDQVIVGKGANVFSSFYWLAMWCMRQLKKARLHLKIIGGKTVREQY